MIICRIQFLLASHKSITTGVRESIFTTIHLNYLAATKEVVHQLITTYKAKLKEFDLRCVQISVNFLERIFSGDGGEINCVHSDWPVVLDQLKKWLNQNMTNFLNARLFVTEK